MFVMFVAVDPACAGQWDLQGRNRRLLIAAEDTKRRGTAVTEHRAIRCNLYAFDIIWNHLIVFGYLCIIGVYMTPPVNRVFFIHVQPLRQLMFDVPAGAVHLAAKGGQHEVRTMHVFSKGCKDHNLPNLNLNYPPHSIYIVFTVSVYMSL